MEILLINISHVKNSNNLLLSSDEEDNYASYPDLSVELESKKVNGWGRPRD